MTPRFGILRFLIAQLAALAALALLAPPPPAGAASDLLTGGDGDTHLWGQGQGTGGAGRGGDAGAGGTAPGRSYSARGVPVPLTGAPLPAPAQVAAILNRASRLCATAPKEYRLDCVLLFIRQSAEVLPQYGDMGQARRVLEQTAGRLDGIVRANLDPTKPPIRLQTNASPLERATPRMRAIRPEAIAPAHRQAARVLAEAETILLRSSPSNADVRLEYVRIASAVGSNKLLIRS